MEDTLVGFGVRGSWRIEESKWDRKIFGFWNSEDVRDTRNLKGIEKFVYFGILRTLEVRKI